MEEAQVNLEGSQALVQTQYFRVTVIYDPLDLAPLKSSPTSTTPIPDNIQQIIAIALVT